MASHLAEVSPQTLPSPASTSQISVEGEWRVLRGLLKDYPPWAPNRQGMPLEMEDVSMLALPSTYPWPPSHASKAYACRKGTQMF